MNSLIHADVFFFITSIAVVAVTLLVAVILFYVAMTARTISKITEKIKKESDEVLEDLSIFREKIKENSSHMSGFGKWLMTVILGKSVSAAFKNFSKKSTKTKAKVHEEDEE